MNLRERRELVARLREQVSRLASPPLEIYWAIGDVLAGLDRPYGRNDIANLARVLRVGHTLLYDALRFRELWPRKADLRRAERRGLTFGHVRCLLHKKLSSGDREILERAVEKECLGMRALKERVQQAVAGRPDPLRRRKGRSSG